MTTNEALKEVNKALVKLKHALCGDETRLYDCGGIPVELTLPEESMKEHFVNKFDIFQYGIYETTYGGYLGRGIHRVNMIKFINTNKN